MKKLCSILLCLLILPLMLVGCNKANTTADDGFVEVQSIEYTIGSDKPVNFTSCYAFIASDWNTVSREDYFNDTTHQKFSGLEGTFNINKEQTLTRINEYLNREDEIFYYSSPDWEYYSIRITGINYYYVKVKLLDNGIEIVFKDQHYLINTSNYVITYFN